jgi:hypothetical protein
MQQLVSAPGRSLGQRTSQAKEAYVKNPASLGSDRKWFIPGLAYSFAKLQDSVFSLVGYGSNVDTSVVTHMVPTPVLVARNFRLPADNWVSTVQGISTAFALDFIPRLEHLRFVRGGPTWRLRAVPVKLSDPLSPLRLVDAFIILPEVLGRFRTEVAGIHSGVTIVVEVKHV